MDAESLVAKAEATSVIDVEAHPVAAHWLIERLAEALSESLGLEQYSPDSGSEADRG